MNETSLLVELILLLALTAAGLALFERFGLPAIAGFLVVGALAGPGVGGIVSDPERVRVLAEVGVIFLLFEIGLELPLERLRDLGRMALIVGGGQVILTTALVGVAAALLGVPPASAWLLGCLISMSSTALVMRMLADQGQVDAPHGRLTVSVLIFQDLAIVPFLLVIPFLAGGGEDRAPLDLVLAVLKMLAALAAVLFIVRGGVPRLLDRVAKARSPDLFSLLTLLIVLGSAFLAEELGLTLAVGAFLAGVAASSSPYAQQLFSEVVPLRGVILGIFFTAIGMFFEPAALVAHAPLILLYLAVTLLLKAGLVAAVSTWVLGHGLRVGLLAGFALAQTGEFSFVLAQAAMQAGLLDQSLYQIVLSGSILSLILSPFVVRAAPFVVQAATNFLERSDDLLPPGALAEAQGDSLAYDRRQGRERVVIVGYGPAGQTLARLLRALEIPFLVIDSNPLSVRRAQADEGTIIFGDATRPILLQKLGVETARLVVVAISDPLATRRIVARIKQLAPETPILARTRYVGEVDHLEVSGAHHVVAEEFEASIELVARALELFEIPSGAIARFTQALRDEGYGAIRSPAALPMDPWLVELLDEPDTNWLECPAHFAQNRSLEGLNIRASTGCSVLAVERAGAATSNPAPSFVLRPGDRLLVLGDAAGLTSLRILLEAGDTDFPTRS